MNSFQQPNSDEPSLGTLHILDEGNRPGNYLAAGTSAAVANDTIGFDCSSYVPVGAKGVLITAMSNTNNRSITAVPYDVIDDPWSNSKRINHLTFWSYTAEYESNTLIVGLASNRQFRLYFPIVSTAYWITLEGYWI